jgi:hypothetical protein
MKKITMKEAREIALKILHDAESERAKVLSDEQHDILLQNPLYRTIVTRKAE